MTKAKIEALEKNIELNENNFATQRDQLLEKIEEQKEIKAHIQELQDTLATKDENKKANEAIILKTLQQTISILTPLNITAELNEDLVNDSVQGINFIAQQIMLLEKQSAALQDGHDARLNSLLMSIQDIINTHNGFPRNEINQVINASGLVTKSPKKGLEGLLLLIGGNIANYGLLKKDATQRADLIKTISLKQTALKEVLSNSNLEALAITEAIDTLNPLNEVITSAYKIKNNLVTEISEISSEITELSSQIAVFEKNHIIPITSRLDSLREEHDGLLEQLEPLKAEFAEEEKQRLIYEGKPLRTLLVTRLKAELEAYKINRGKSFKLKDAFSSKDQEERAGFITTINEQLQAFVLTGDNSQVIDTLTAAINDENKFKGKQFKPVLNKLVAELLRENKINGDIQLLRQEGVKVLTKLGENPANGFYINQINQLTANIDKIHLYAANLPEPQKSVMEKLAYKLQCDIENFIIANPGQLPSKSDFSEFKKVFTAGLHSEDGIMLKHKKTWQPLVTTTTASLFHLGNTDSVNARNSNDVFFDEAPPVPPKGNEADNLRNSNAI